MSADTIPSIAGYIRTLAQRIGQGQHGLTDTELLDRFVDSQDEAAFEVLVWRHGGMVLGVCRRLLTREPDAEDAFQATFLALVRKSATISRKESLAGWLYQVAYRAALATRERANRHEPLTDALFESITAALPEEDWGDLRPVLDSEVNRLPAKLRAAFVLCCLEGKTVDEAAAELGHPRGTIASWISRAREKLRNQLIRRGVAMPAAALAVALSRTATAAPPPSILAQTTAHAAALTVAGKALPAGLLPPHIPTITQGVLSAMFATKLKFAAFVVAAVTVVAVAAGVFARQSMATEPVAFVPANAVSAEAANPAAPAAEPKPFKVTVIIRGVTSEEDAATLRATLKKVPGIKVNTDTLTAGEKGRFGHYFSPPLVIEVTDPAKSDLGAIAKAVAAAKTSKRADIPPSLNVVLYAANGKIEESDIAAVREAVGDLNGVDARAAGGTVGNLTDATISIRLDDSGNATLADILAALKKADLDFRVEKP